MVQLIPIFQYSNMYTVTPKLRELPTNQPLKKECLSFVAKSERHPPTFRDVFQMYWYTTTLSTLSSMLNLLFIIIFFYSRTVEWLTVRPYAISAFVSILIRFELMNSGSYNSASFRVSSAVSANTQFTRPISITARTRGQWRHSTDCALVWHRMTKSAAALAFPTKN